jgi:predicted DsbA family dithiol-disulfide isomerase
MEVLKQSKQTIKVSIVSDVVCPWCYIGKKRLETAMETLKHQFDFDLEFLPFQLDPTIPLEGVEQKAYFIKKFGSEERMESVFNQVEAVGQSVGIDFNFLAIPKAINTLPLHKIVAQAKEEGIQLAVKQALFEAYMVQPVDLTDTMEVTNVMEQFGWSVNKTLAVLNDSTLQNNVKADIAHMQKLGISGVPFFIINNEFGISGAQTPETFIEAFKSLQTENSQVSAGDSCQIGEDC